MVSAIAGGVASAAAGKLLGGGKSSSGGGSPILGLAGDGIAGSFARKGGKIRVRQSEQNKTLINQIQEALGSQADVVRGAVPGFNQAYGGAITGVNDLLARVAPGVSELRDSRLTGLENARQRSLSDLKQNLSRRRVLGSSFAQDDAARQNLAFNQEADRIRSESFLQEIGLTSEFLDKKLELEVGQIDTELKNYLSALQFEQTGSEIELENQKFLTQIGAQIASGATAAATALRSQELEQSANASAGAGQFFGSIDYGSVFDKVFGGGSAIFGGGGATFGNSGIQNDQIASAISGNLASGFGGLG